MRLTVEQQLSEVRKQYPNAEFDVIDGGIRLLVVPSTPLVAGWNREDTLVAFQVASGYPQVKLDCFYTDAGLTLANGSEPQNSSLQGVGSRRLRWFSWHLATWDPALASLDRYLRFCERRLREVR